MNNILSLRLLFLFCALVLRCAVNLDIEGEREFLQPLRQKSDEQTLPDNMIIYCWKVFSVIPDDERVRFLQTLLVIDRMMRETPKNSAFFAEWMSFVQEGQRKMELIRHEGQKTPALLQAKREHGQEEQRKKDLVDRQEKNVLALLEAQIHCTQVAVRED
ncbi:MAG: hypothetical protein OXC30_04225 [Alphaproteobacteria bacterium]|nr:hypothetical protein [Alphaproteobacteria bacterium]